MNLHFIVVASFSKHSINSFLVKLKTAGPADSQGDLKDINMSVRSYKSMDVCKNSVYCFAICLDSEFWNQLANMSQSEILLKRDDEIDSQHTDG